MSGLPWQDGNSVGTFRAQEITSTHEIRTGVSARARCPSERPAPPAVTPRLNQELKQERHSNRLSPGPLPTTTRRASTVPPISDGYYADNSIAGATLGPWVGDIDASQGRTNLGYSVNVPVSHEEMSSVELPESRGQQHPIPVNGQFRSQFLREIRPTVIELPPRLLPSAIPAVPSPNRLTSAIPELDDDFDTSSRSSLESDGGEEENSVSKSTREVQVETLQEDSSSDSDFEPLSQIIIDHLRKSRSALANEPLDADDGQMPCTLYHMCGDRVNGVIAAECRLMDMVQQCLDYDTSEQLLKQGRIKQALAFYRIGDSSVIPILLIVLLRLVASVKGSAQHLWAGSEVLFEFLTWMMKKDEDMLDIFKNRQASDSRIYSSLKAIALAAHSRPHIYDDQQRPTFKTIAFYESHARTAYEACKGSTLSEGLEDIPRVLKPTLSSFKISTLAIDAFIDFAHSSGPGFGAEIWGPIIANNAKPVFSYLDKCLHTSTSLRFRRILHSVPDIASRLISRPFHPAETCWNELESYLKNGDQHTTIELATLSARFLGLLLEWPEKESPRYISYITYMQTVDKANLLLDYALDGSIGDADLYEAVWALLHSISFTFPGMFKPLLAAVLLHQGRSLLEFGSVFPDTDIDFDSVVVTSALAGNAAMYVGTVIIFLQPNLPKEMISACSQQLLEFAAAAPNPETEAQRNKLAYQLQMMLHPQIYTNEAESLSIDTRMEDLRRHSRRGKLHSMRALLNSFSDLSQSSPEEQKFSVQDLETSKQESVEPGDLADSASPGVEDASLESDRLEYTYQQLWKVPNSPDALAEAIQRCSSDLQNVGGLASVGLTESESQAFGEILSESDFNGIVRNVLRNRKRTNSRSEDPEWKRQRTGF